MPVHSDVLIIGGGVIGLTTAHYLSHAGVSVVLLDQGEVGRQASWAGAGIIPPGNARRTRTAYDALRAHSSEMYPALSHELSERTSIDNGYVVCGGLEIVEHSAEAAIDAWREEGIAFEAWNAGQLRERFPHIGPSFATTYYLPRMAQVRNPRHLKALSASCRNAGVEFRTGSPVRGFVRAGERVTAVETDAGRLSAGAYLVAAGAWSDRLLQSIGWQSGIRPVRGQIALLQTTAALRPILLHGLRYLVPRLDGRVLVGSTEEEVEFDARPTARAIAELLAFATDLVPTLADATLERCWAGLRPASLDGLPYLGLVPGLDNLFVAAGHYRAGIQLSPATGWIMKQLLLHETPLFPVDAFRLDRPPAAPGALAFRS